MNKVIEKIQRLNSTYPNNIKLYAPVGDIKVFQQAEESLSVKVDNQLQQLYSFSNGLGCIDYCLYGFQNKEIGGFVDNVLDIWHANEDLEKKYVSFMGTSGGTDFGYLVNDEGLIHQVVLIRDLIDGNYEVIASSLEEFFNRFLDKIETVLKRMKPENIVDYILEWK